MQHHEQTVARYDIYARIHKGIRAIMSETLSATGRCDWHDRDECAQTLAQVRDLADFCFAHLTHENQFLHPALEARAPTTSMAVAHEHVEHEAAIKRLRTQAAAVEMLNGDARLAAGEALYRMLAAFVGENFLHMHDEETRHNAVLWATYSDAEIAGIEQALVRSLTPAENQQSMRWMIPSMTHQERVALFAGMREHAPAPVFEGTLAMARGLLPAADWNKLNAALQLDVEVDAA